MKRIILLLLAVLLISNPALAFLYDDVKFLSVEEIKKLSDEDLIQTYIDAKIETNASKTFHANAGFNSAKDYKKYKELLVLIIRLRQELELRGKEAPPVDEWLD